MFSRVVGNLNSNLCYVITFFLNIGSICLENLYVLFLRPSPDRERLVQPRVIEINQILTSTGMG